MKKLLPLIALSLMACESDKVFLPDYKDLIDSNTARIELLEVKTQAQELRLDVLEADLSALETRVSDLEDRMDQAEGDILTLFGQVTALHDEMHDELDDLWDALLQEIQDRRDGDRILLRKIRRLRRQLIAEIQARQAVDNNLFSQIMALDTRLTNLENAFMLHQTTSAQALLALQTQLQTLESVTDARLDALEQGMSLLQSDVSSLQADVAALQSTVTNLQAQIDDVESRLTEVVYPCSFSNEVLLKTQDGFVGFFIEKETVTITAPVSMTVPGFTVPRHFDRYAYAIHNNHLHFRFRIIPAFTQPAQTVSSSATFTLTKIKNAYMNKLPDGSYMTTDGTGCTFTIQNGQLL